jgi:hypothetical protein
MVFFLMLVPLFLNSFSQQAEDETSVLSPKGSTQGSLAFQAGAGPLFFHMPGQDHIRSQLALDGNFLLFYNHLFVKGELFSFDFRLRDPVEFDHYVFPTDAEFTVMNFDGEIGYSIDLDEQWGIDLRMGGAFREFSLLNEEDIGFDYTSQVISGPVFGLTINRYVSFSRSRFLVIGLNMDYAAINYGEISPDLNKGSIQCSLIVAFKMRFQHRKS